MTIEGFSLVLGWALLAVVGQTFFGLGDQKRKRRDLSPASPVGKAFSDMMAGRVEDVGAKLEGDMEEVLSGIKQ